MNKLEIFDKRERRQDTLKEYANRIFNCSVIGGNAIRRIAGGHLPQTIWLSIVFEFLFFYIALTRGDALKDVPSERKEKLMDMLGDLLISGAVNFVFDDKQGEAQDGRIRRYKQEALSRMEDYGLHETMLGSESGEVSKKSALWAFCNTISKLAGRPGDLTYLMTAHAHINDSMLVLRMKGLSETPV